MKLSRSLFILFVTWTASSFAEPVEIASLLQSADEHIGKEIVIEGLMVHVCKHGGKRAFFKDMKAEEDKSIRVESYQCPVFDQIDEGSMMRVAGILRELRIDVAYLDNWESKVREHMVEEAHEHDHADGEDKGCGGCGGSHKKASSENSALQRIAAMREKVAASSRGYIPSYWVDGTEWEIIDNT